MSEKVNYAIELLKSDETLQKTNLTDPDAPIMKGKKGNYDTFFNVQVGCNEDQIINYCNVVVEGNDKNQLIQVLEGTAANTGDQIEIALADADYGTFDSFEYMSDNSICGYVPFRDMNSTFDDKPYHSSHFDYDTETDTYTCPAGQQLTYVRNRKNTTRKTEYRQYRTDACKQCPYREACCPKSRTRRTIERELRQHLKDEMKLRLKSDQEKKMYNRRMHPVESIFGHFKYNLGYTQFLLRGSEKVIAEFILMCLAHNLRKLTKFSISDFFRPKIRKISKHIRHAILKLREKISKRKNHEFKPESYIFKYLNTYN